MSCFSCVSLFLFLLLLIGCCSYLVLFVVFFVVFAVFVFVQPFVLVLCLVNRLFFFWLLLLLTYHLLFFLGGGCFGFVSVVFVLFCFRYPKMFPCSFRGFFPFFLTKPLSSKSFFFIFVFLSLWSCFILLCFLRLLLIFSSSSVFLLFFPLFISSLTFVHCQFLFQHFWVLASRSFLPFAF